MITGPDWTKIGRQELHYQMGTLKYDAIWGPGVEVPKWKKQNGCTYTGGPKWLDLNSWT